MVTAHLRHLWRHVTMGMAFLLAVAFLQCTRSTGDESSFEDDTTPRVKIPYEPPLPLADHVEPELRELVKIRRQLNPHGLQGTLFEAKVFDAEVENSSGGVATTETHDQAFLSALRSLERTGPCATGGWDKGNIALCETGCGNLPAEDIPLAEEFMTDRAAALNGDHPLSDLPLTEALLATSRRLDQEVHQLDRRGEYDQADRLRRLANRLRVEVRSLR